MIDDVKPEDAGDYTFVPDGYALSLSAKLNFLGKRENQEFFLFLIKFKISAFTKLCNFVPTEIKIDYVPRQGKCLTCIDKSNNIACVRTTVF